MIGIQQLPDEVLYKVLEFLPHTGPGSGPRDVFDYSSNIRNILGNKDTDWQSLLSTNVQMRRVVMGFLRRRYRQGFQLSLARTTEKPSLAEYRRLKNGFKLNAFTVIDTISLWNHVTRLEICLNFLESSVGWSRIAKTFSQVRSLALLGNTEGFYPVFSYELPEGRFTNLTSLALPIPDSPKVFSALGQSLEWGEISQLTLFADPYGSYSSEITGEVMDLLIERLSRGHLKCLHLIGGNNIIFNNSMMLSKMASLLQAVPELESVSILHHPMRSPSFSAFAHSYDNSFGYHDFSEPFIDLFENLGKLENLKRLTIDINPLRVFHRELDQVFQRVKFFSNPKFELTLVEPTFAFPLSQNYIEQILRFILLTQPTELSFKFGLQIELSMDVSTKSLIQQLAQQLITKFNYFKLQSVSSELCWSIVEDSYIMEHNDRYPDDQLMRWQRPHMASSFYKQLRTETFRYEQHYPNHPIDQNSCGKIFRSELIPYKENRFEMVEIPKHPFQDETKRLQFWTLACSLDDFVVVNNSINRKESIFF